MRPSRKNEDENEIPHTTIYLLQEVAETLVEAQSEVEAWDILSDDDYHRDECAAAVFTDFRCTALSDEDLQQYKQENDDRDVVSRTLSGIHVKPLRVPVQPNSRKKKGKRVP